MKKTLFLSIAFFLLIGLAVSSYADNLATDAQLSLISGTLPGPFPPLPNPDPKSANSGSISSSVSYSPNNSSNPSYSKASADDTGKTATHVWGWGMGGAVLWENYASAIYTTADLTSPYNFNFAISGPTLGLLDPSSTHTYSGEYAKYLITISDGSNILWSSGAKYSYGYDSNGNLITSLSGQIGTPLTGGTQSHIINDWKYQFDNYNGTIALSENGTYNITTTIQVWADYSGLEKGAYASIGDPDNLSSSNFSGTLTPSSPTSAPEPTTMLLLGLGLIGLAGVRRKFKQ